MTLEEEKSTASKMLGMVLGYAAWAIFVLATVAIVQKCF